MTETTAPLTPEREQEIRDMTRGEARMAPRGWMATSAELLAEIDRLRGELSAARSRALNEGAEAIDAMQNDRDDLVNAALGGLPDSVLAEHKTSRRAARMLRRMAADAVGMQGEETHVVADDSDDPEHIDDCPGCEQDESTCACGHGADRHDETMGGCIECRCRRSTPTGTLGGAA